MGAHSHGQEVSEFDLHQVKESHYELLGSYLGSRSDAEDAIFYSYTKHINGFAAVLEEERALEIARLEDDGEVPPFSIWEKARFGEDTIIANFDTDYDGHGTHTLSTAGGSFVKDASVFGFGKGVAKGGSPRARVAAYKVCWPPINGSECYDADILAAFDAAIADGVDVISASLGGTPTPYFNDSLSIGSFHAVKKNIDVVCSAGNSGPTDGTVVNVSPWIFTVGASTMDREFSNWILLGNGRHFEGQSLAPKSLQVGKYYPLVSAAQVKAANASIEEAQLCKYGTMDPNKARGKIVVCLRGDNARVDKGQQVALVGGVGMVLANDQDTANEIIVDPHVLPASHINYRDGVHVYDYIKSTKSAKASITQTSTRLGIKPSPFMAAFSSKGPNTVTPEILKPDITAPGVSVIAAYTEAQGPTNQVFDKRRVQFNSISGTSMSCPHISGVVGLLKTIYPHWSPATIKSAIMTTASIIDNVYEPITNASKLQASPLHYGAGHVQPNPAMDPGLVYDMNINDYLNFLCAIGYNETSISLFNASPYVCPKNFSILNLNYPSITIPNLRKSTTVTRTLKNVGSPGKYIAHVQSPREIAISVHPSVLEFTSIGQEKSFQINIKAKKGKASKDYVFGRLTWLDGMHYVSSPITVKSV
uniref:Uncharacterized protein n=1 Tax=Chenopodium quinoa TaxID=63459 RepID=A0A803MY77_CHEQI